MAWSIVLSLLFLVLRAAFSQPTLTPTNFIKTNSCSDYYLVEGKDFLLFEYEAAGSNTKYPFHIWFQGPNFFYTTTASKTDIYSPDCYGFRSPDNKCIDRTGQPNACTCIEVQPSKVYRFIFNMTADRIFSNQTLWMTWGFSPHITSKPYGIPEIRAKMELLSFQSSFTDNEDFLVAGEDTTVLQIEVSGNNSVHSFDEKNGPKFYYTTTDGVSHEACTGFDPATGSCRKRTGVRDACSCEMKTSTKYWLSYSKTAAVDTSKATVYLLWPGRPDLRSDDYTFPEIRAIGTFYIKLFIGLGLVSILVTVAGACVLVYMKYGGAKTRNNQDQVSPDVGTQMETEQHGEVVEKYQKAEDETETEKDRQTEID
ncbi:hypothetical protein RRG08_010445 [Elysia crispata]|uniref:Uncharacterized protein n=1 Tax=Elysia crispata TaxID=231223 RepID=A0AAE1DVD8_9GAST|nr:hypothetical protein RRG08_010445 [Elysia crispata]